jgi:GAF domain-containing protein
MSRSNETRDYFRALYTVAHAAVSSIEQEQVLANIARSVTEALHVKACVIRLLGSDRETLGMRTAYGLSERYLAKGSVGVARSLLDRETLQGHPVIVPRVADDPRFQYPQAAAKEGLVSALCVPLQARGEAIGVMRAYTGEPHDFTEEEVEFVQAIADLAALAIVNARLYEEARRDYKDTMTLLWGGRLS